MELRCELSIPYPKVETCGKNPCYANLLMPAYAGKISELSAIMQYLYQNTILEFTDEALATCLKRIAMIEMKHYKMIAQLIFCFGGDPKLLVKDSNKSQYWIGCYPSYEKNIIPLLCCNIQGEQQAIDDYSRIAKQINDQKAVKVIERIILDEQNHLKLMQAFLEKYKNAPCPR